MPARSDLDPAEIPILLPFVLLVEKAAGDRLRYRLVGTAVVNEVGRDLTGDFVGSYVSGAKSAARMKAIYERALTRLHPVFATLSGSRRCDKARQDAAFSGGVRFPHGNSIRSGPSQVIRCRVFSVKPSAI